MKLEPDSVGGDPPLQRAEHANLKFCMPCRKTDSTSRSQDRASEGCSPSSGSPSTVSSPKEKYAMKSTLLTAALLVALAGTASASNNVDTYNREDNSVPTSVMASRNDCVNRILSVQCP